MNSSMVVLSAESRMLQIATSADRGCGFWVLPLQEISVNQIIAFRSGQRGR